ncbi:MATE family efflux transporter [Clostridium sp. 'deep sea']|uniref:MATE family efflux transporter n=1 Tax=Clostridium sp. 'deep sea' TaxID=2779445 RepID=UPI00325FADF5
MSLPVMLSMVMQTFYSLVDMIWIGRISAVAVAGVTVFSSLYFLVGSLNSIIGGGSVTVLSQSFGSGDKEKARTAIANTFAFKLLVGIIAAIVLSLALEPLLNHFTDDPQVLNDALAYGRIRAIFMPIMFSSFTVTTALRCSGDSRSPMYITLLSAVLNIVLDPIFIFDKVPYIGIPGLGLGVFGAALATVISVTLSFIISYWLMFGPKSVYKLKLSDFWNIDWSIVYRIVKIGIPQATSQMLRNLANVIMLGFITSYGTLALAAWGIVSRILNLLFMPIFGLMQGSGTVVGQNIGAKQYDRAVESSNIASKIGFLVMMVVAILGYKVAPQVVNLFTDNGEVTKMGGEVLRIIIISMPFVALYMGKATIFTGTGYTLPFLISGVVGQWIVQIPVMYLITKLWNLPFVYLAASNIAYTVVEGVLIFYFFARGNWKAKVQEKAVE